MTRREIRECIFCLLFQYNFYEEEEFTEQMANFLTEKKLSETNEMEIREKIDRLTEKLPDIDEKMRQMQRAGNWTVLQRPSWRFCAWQFLKHSMMKVFLLA